MSAVGTAIAYLYTCLAGYKVIKHTPSAYAPGRLLICGVGAFVSILCIVLLLAPGSPALIGPAPRRIMIAWIVLGFIFYRITRPDWINLPEGELRERILGSRDLPVFFHK